MATKVQSIVTQANSMMATYLTGWRELEFVFDVSKNDIRTGHKGYGIHPLSASNAETVTGFYTLDHQFETILAQRMSRHTDSEKWVVLYDLYDKQDELFQLFKAQNINLSGTVLGVFDPSTSEPEFLQNELVVLRQQFYVKYRNTVP